MKASDEFHERTNGQAPLAGVLQLEPSVSFARIAKEALLDFVIVDAEHGSFTELELELSVQRLLDQNILTLLRIRACEPEFVEASSRFGMHALVVPHVESTEVARQLVSAVKDSACALVVMIESATGVREADRILKVDGVKGVFIGPYDLSTDLGAPGAFSASIFEDAVESIERAARASGKVLGSAVVPGHAGPALAKRGHSLIVVGSEQGILRAAMEAKAAELAGHR